MAMVHSNLAGVTGGRQRATRANTDDRATSRLDGRRAHELHLLAAMAQATGGVGSGVQPEQGVHCKRGLGTSTWYSDQEHFAEPLWGPQMLF
jgi:hypothetical protein